MPYPVLSIDDATTRQLENLCRRNRPIRRNLAGQLPGSETLLSQRLETTWERTWRFPSGASARSWNDQWDRVLADPGHRHPALLTPADALSADAALEVVACIASGIVHEEVRAGTPPPEVRAGCSFQLSITHAYELRPFPARREELLLRLSWSVLDPAGEASWNVECTREYDLRHLPAEAPLLLMRPHRSDAFEALPA